MSSVELTRQAPPTSRRLRPARGRRRPPVLPVPAPGRGLDDRRPTEDPPVRQDERRVAGRRRRLRRRRARRQPRGAAWSRPISWRGTPAGATMIDHVSDGRDTLGAGLAARRRGDARLARTPARRCPGLDAPFDTYASMTHLLGAEGGRPMTPPRALAYLCSALPDDVRRCRTSRHVPGEWSKALWPAERSDLARRSTGRWPTTCRQRRPVGPLRAVAPGIGAAPPPAPTDPGVDHLVLAGDWTDCGINAGCIEAAAVSGIQAAAAVEGRPLTDRVLGPLTWDWAMTKTSRPAARGAVRAARRCSTRSQPRGDRWTAATAGHFGQLGSTTCSGGPSTPPCGSPRS